MRAIKPEGGCHTVSCFTRCGTVLVRPVHNHLGGLYGGAKNVFSNTWRIISSL